MSHLDEGILHAVLDGEVPSIELADVNGHLAACQECQLRLDEARALRTEAFGLVESLDQPPMVVPAPRHNRVLVPDGHERHRTRWWVPASWAASLIGALGIGYMVSHSDRSADMILPVDQAAAPDSGDKQSALASPRRETQVANEATPEPAKAKRRPAALPAAPVTQPVTAAADSPAPVLSQQSVSQSGPQPLAKAAAPPAPEVAAKEEDEVKRAEALAELRRTSLVAARGRRSADAETARGGASAANALDKKVLRLDRPSPPNPADQRTRIVSAVGAIRALGGSIRLVDGMTPTRFELTGEVIRVVYRTAFGIMTLEQWRSGELLAYELVTTAGTPPDSVLAWEKRIR